MIHAREDYNRIQDPENKIPESEPVFLLRATDVLAPGIVEEWARRAELIGANENIIKAANGQAIRMREWQQSQGSKVPDM